MARAFAKQNKTKKKRKKSFSGRIERPSTYILLLVGISIPFVLVILLGDRHSVPGGLVNVVICLYPHFVWYGAEALQTSTKEKKKNKKAEVNQSYTFLILNKETNKYIHTYNT